MDKLFGFTADEMKIRNMINTASEIARQPKTWISIYDKIINRHDEISKFLSKFEDETRIIFTGAGSSGFVGDSLEPIIRKNSRFKHVESIHTTDIVSNPQQYLVGNLKTVLVSFGRSGNSPESVAALELAEEIIDEVYHIIITCNPEGKLALISNDRTLNITLDEIEDLAFAMTSSVTGMMLAAYTIFCIEKDYNEDVKKLAISGKKIIEEKYETIFEALDTKANRLVVLGSANLYGAAREGALKSTELTAGKISTRYDTPMGFRHGPKSFLNEKTVILFFASNNKYTLKYDLDMLQELSIAKKHKLIVVSDSYEKEVEKFADIYLYNDYELPEEFTAFIPILVAQIYSLKASLLLECTPDNPFPTGEVNRVVKGVTIYEY